MMRLMRVFQGRDPRKVVEKVGWTHAFKAAITLAMAAAALGRGVGTVGRAASITRQSEFRYLCYFRSMKS
jgi:hypothetical protein